ncbi:MAG: hypothetical protein MJ252_31100, partial [archaeon]|nr:hypothetical protein [archaeon]
METSITSNGKKYEIKSTSIIETMEKTPSEIIKLNDDRICISYWTSPFVIFNENKQTIDAKGTKNFSNRSNISLLPDGNIITVGNNINIYDASSKDIKLIKSLPDFIYSKTLILDNERMVFFCAERMKVVEIKNDFKTLKEIVFKSPNENIFRVNESKVICVGGGKISLWDLNKYEEEKTMDIEKKFCHTLIVKEDKIYCGEEEGMTIINLSSFQIETKIINQNIKNIWAMLLYDEENILIAQNYGELSLFNIKTLKFSENFGDLSSQGGMQMKRIKEKEFVVADSVGTVYFFEINERPLTEEEKNNLNENIQVERDIRPTRRGIPFNPRGGRYIRGFRGRVIRGYRGRGTFYHPGFRARGFRGRYTRGFRGRTIRAIRGIRGHRIIRGFRGRQFYPQGENSEGFRENFNNFRGRGNEQFRGRGRNFNNFRGERGRGMMIQRG